MNDTGNMTAQDLYSARNDAHIEQARWERRARNYAQRGKAEYVEDATQRADEYAAKAAEFQRRADELDGNA